MFAHAANVYVTRYYYAMEKALLPVVTGVLSVFGLNVVIIVLFINKYGALAIAWGTTVSAYFQLIILILYALFKMQLTLNTLAHRVN
jgi:putative peptidoglycan lipid II flippase